MATAFRAEGLTQLRRIDPDAAELSRALAAIFEAAELSPRTLHEITPGAWFACEDGVRFRFAGELPLHEERISDAIALLDVADPLLRQVEAALGLSLEPVGIDTDPPDQAAVLAVGDVQAGEIAVPTGHPARRRWEEAATALGPRLDATPLVVTVAIDGPRLSIAEANALMPGDLVLFGARAAAAVQCPPLGSFAGQLDLVSGIFTPQSQGAPMAGNPAEPPVPRDFAVPLTLRLPDRMTSAASLAELRPGTALPLGPITDGMPVELLVAGRTLARGELVQLGDRFAVLIEERPSIDDGLGASTEAEAVAMGADA